MCKQKLQLQRKTSKFKHLWWLLRLLVLFESLWYICSGLRPLSPAVWLSLSTGTIYPGPIYITNATTIASTLATTTTITAGLTQCRQIAKLWHVSLLRHHDWLWHTLAPLGVGRCPDTFVGAQQFIHTDLQTYRKHSKCTEVLHQVAIAIDTQLKRSKFAEENLTHAHGKHR